jgi:hypothetical protein
MPKIVCPCTLKSGQCKHSCRPIKLIFKDWKLVSMESAQSFLELRERDTTNKMGATGPLEKWTFFLCWVFSLSCIGNWGLALKEMVSEVGIKCIQSFSSNDGNCALHMRLVTSISSCWGIGPAATTKLAQFGVNTIEHLRWLLVAEVQEMKKVLANKDGGVKSIENMPVLCQEAMNGDFPLDVDYWASNNLMRWGVGWIEKLRKSTAMRHTWVLLT